MARGYRARHGRNCPVSTGGRRCAKLESCGYQGEFHHSVGGKAKTVRSNKANSGVTLFATVAEAKAWTVAQQNDVQNLGIVRSTSQITLREFWESWLKLADDGLVYQRGGDRYASKTLAGYKSNMARLLKDHADKKVSTIDTPWLERELRQIRNDLSASSANGTMTAVRALFRDSAEVIQPHGISPNPAERLKLFKNRAVREVEPSSAEGVRDRLAALPDTERPLWALFFYAGLRLAEAQGLRWQDVDDFPEQETVQRADLPDAGGLSEEEQLSWVPDPTKPRSQPFVRVRHSWDGIRRELKEPKSLAGRRDVPLSKDLEPWLDAQRDRQRYAGASTVPTAFVFTQRNATDPFDEHTIGRRARKAWKAKGLSPMTPHDARHWYGALQLEFGVPLYAVSAFMGHSNIQETAKTYARVLGADVAQAAAAAAYAGMNRV